MRVGWLVDDPGYIGGAELTADEFADAAPDDVHIEMVPPDKKWMRYDIDVYVVHNCVQYGRPFLKLFEHAPVVKYVHDVWPHGDRDVRNWMLQHAHLVLTSPLHRQAFPYPLTRTPLLVPPPMQLDAFRLAAERRSGMERNGRALVLAHHGKGAENAYAWGLEHGVPVDVRGEYTEAGPVPCRLVPDLMAEYTHFVHLPNSVEPFGRTVVEAWTAGCNVVADNCGSLFWTQQHPDAFEPGKAAGWFWDHVRAVAEGRVQR